MNTKTLLMALLIGLLMPWPSFAADDMQARLLDLQHRWAHINYEIDGDDAQAKAYEKLETQADALKQAYPDRADPLIWEGIILSSHAGATGGLGALGLVKKARKDFEKAIEIDPTAQKGSAHTSLGVLYYRTPGWPLAFGSNEKAQLHLRKALQISPTSIDANYFYAEFLADEKEDYRQALTYIERAEKAPKRPDRPLADAGRHADLRALRRKVEAKLDD